jgi:hypothetical protein
LLDIWREVPVASPLFFSLVSNKLVNDTLIDALCGQARNERVPQNVVAAQHLPFAACDRPFEMVVSFVPCYLRWGRPLRLAADDLHHLTKQ